MPLKKLTRRLPRLTRAEALILLPLLIAGAILRFNQFDLAYFSCHVARDLYRSQGILASFDIPFFGSELQYGGRTFGPYCYFLYAIPLAFTSSLSGVAFFAAALNWFALVATYFFARAWLGTRVALAAVAFYTFFPLELIQIRYLWNPVFLPLLTLIFAVGVFRLAFRKDGRGLPIALAAFFVGFNVHFSMAELLPLLIWALFRGARHTAATIALSVFILGLGLAPPIVGELRSPAGNLEKVGTEVAREEGRWRFNYYAAKSFLRHTFFEPDETAHEVGFRYLGFVQEWHGATGSTPPAWLTPLEKYAYIQLALWAAGFGVCLALAFGFWRPQTGFLAKPHTRGVCGALVAWQMIPLTILSFFNFHPSPGELAIVSLRYFLIVYPANFLTMGIGVAALLGGFEGWRDARHGRAASGALIAAFALLLVGQAVFNLYHVDLIRRSGRIIPYAGIARMVPNSRVSSEVARVLVEEFQLHPDDLYERVHSPDAFTTPWGEHNLDWLVTQSRAAWDNPRLPDDTSIIIYFDDPRNRALDPFWRAAERRREIKGIRVMRVIGEIPETIEVGGAPVPLRDNSGMRNYWYQDTRMEPRFPPWQ